VKLLEDLEGHVWNQGQDGWVWKREEDGAFTMKSMYKKLEDMFILEDIWNVEEKRIFEQLWKSPAPSKVVAFSWKMLLDRIPTRINLSRRNALPPEVPLRCVMCEMEPESSTHLFLHCRVAQGVWMELLRWVGNMFIIPQNLFNHWACWNAGSSKKKISRGLRLIWHTTIWLIWKARNEKIFKAKDSEVMELVEDIKVWSWRWCLSRLNIPACMFYEWALGSFLVSCPNLGAAGVLVSVWWSFLWRWRRVCWVCAALLLLCEVLLVLWICSCMF